VGSKSARPILLAIVAAVCLTVSACTASPPSASNGETSPTPDTSAAPEVPEAAMLVGQWRVVDAAGTGPDTWLRLGLGVEVWADCGHAGGSWRVVGTIFVASVETASGGPECLGGPGPAGVVDSLRWLVAATTYQSRENGIALLDGNGDVVATLVDDGSSPPPDPNGPDQGPPQLTPEIVAKLATPAPLPSTATPVGELAGRWLPTDRTDVSYTAELVLSADGFWTGSDGCNGSRGRYVTGQDGLLLTTGGGWTEVGCENSRVLEWIIATSRAGMVGDELVLYDASGEALGSLVRP
jgi:hypothetical protein